MSCIPSLRTVSYIADLIPVVSTVANLFTLFLKAIRPYLFTNAQSYSIITCVEDKTWSRCGLLLVPGFGNVAIAFYDCWFPIQTTNTKPELNSPPKKERSPQELYNMAKVAEKGSSNWIELLQKADTPEAKKDLGNYYLEKATELLHDTNDGPSLYSLGMQYKDVNSLELAKKYFLQSAQLNYTLGMYQYALIMEEEHQDTTAQDFMEQAAIENCKPAIDWLEKHGKEASFKDKLISSQIKEK